MSSQNTAVNGAVTISTANTNRDGTGTIGLLLTAADSGVLVNTITVKAVNSVDNGMVRLFLYNGSNYFLLTEFIVKATDPSCGTRTFETTLNLPSGFYVAPSNSLYVSTERADTFNVILDGTTWAYG